MKMSFISQIKYLLNYLIEKVKKKSKSNNEWSHGHYWKHYQIVHVHQIPVWIMKLYSYSYRNKNQKKGKCKLWH